MRQLLVFSILILTLGFAFAASSNAGVLVPIDDIVENGSFETGDLTGWNVIDTDNSGSWIVYTGTLVPDVEFILLPPPIGNFAVVGEQSDPASTILYQDLDIPNNSETQCSVIVYYMNGSNQGAGAAANSFSRSIVESDPDIVSVQQFTNGDGLNIGPEFPPNQQFRVDIMDPDAPPFDTGSGVLLNLFQTEPGDPEELGYTTLNFDLSPYAGQTVRFRAAFAVTLNELAGSIDDLKCESTFIAAVPALSEWGLIAMAGLIGLIGLYAVNRRRLRA